MTDRYSATYELTAKDVAEGTQLLWQINLMRPFTVLVVLAICVLFTALLRMTSYIPLWIILTAIVIGVPLAVLIVLLVVAPMTGKRHFRQSASLHGPTTMEWDNAGITFSGRKGTTQFEWTDFHGFALSKQYLMLFMTEAVSIIVPRKALGVGESCALNALRQAKRS